MKVSYQYYNHLLFNQNFGEDIQLFYFKKSDIQEDGTVNNKLVFMGCKEDINNNLFFQYSSTIYIYTIF